MRAILQAAGLTFAVYSTLGLAFGKIAQLGRAGAVIVSAVSVLIAARLVFRAFRRERPPAGPVLMGIVAGILATGLVWNTLGLMSLHRAASQARAAGMTTDHPFVDPNDPGNATPLYLALNGVPSLTGGGPRSKDSQTLTDFLVKASSGGIKASDETAVAVILARHADALALARRASDLPRADWFIDWNHDPSWERPTPQHYGAVFVGRALSARAILESRHGKGREAVESLRQGFLMTRALSHEGLLIGSLCEVLVDEALLQALNAVQPRVPPALVQARLGEFFDSAPLESGFWIGLRQEMLADPLHFSNLDWWAISFGKYRGERRDFFAIMPYYWPFIKFDIAAAVRSNLRIMKALKEFIPLKREDYRHEFTVAVNERWLIGYHALPDYSRILDKIHVDTARLREAKVGLVAALYRKEHGRWPAAISDLKGLSADDTKDPFSAGDLTLTKDGAVLSVASAAPDEPAWRVKP